MNLSIENLEFENPTVKEIVEKLVLYAPEFIERRGGGALRSMFFALANTFKEDSHKILSMIEARQREQPATGAKVTRKSDQINVDTKGKRFVRQQQGCDNCPENFVTNATYVSNDEIANELDQTARVVNPKEKAFTSVEDVLDRFEGKEGAMLAFAQKNGIKIPGNVSKSRTIAKIIYEHYNPVNEETEIQDEPQNQEEAL